MSTYAFVFGTAFEIDAPLGGAVRNYSTYNGTATRYFLGHDTYEIEYVCCDTCRTEHAETLTFEQSDCTLDSYVIANSERTEDGLTVVQTLDIQQVFGDWPDYTVECIVCGETIHEGAEDES
jgi:hypothetical protein